MKKNLSAAVFLLAASANAFAQTSAKDSLRVVNLQEVQVVSTRATSKTPVAYSNISQKEIQIPASVYAEQMPHASTLPPTGSR